MDTVSSSLLECSCPMVIGTNRSLSTITHVCPDTVQNAVLQRALQQAVGRQAGQDRSMLIAQGSDFSRALRDSSERASEAQRQLELSNSQLLQRDEVCIFAMLS